MVSGLVRVGFEMCLRRTGTCEHSPWQHKLDQKELILDHLQGHGQVFTNQIAASLLRDECKGRKTQRAVNELLTFKLLLFSARRSKQKVSTNRTFVLTWILIGFSMVSN